MKEETKNSCLKDLSHQTIKDIIAYDDAINYQNTLQTLFMTWVRSENICQLEKDDRAAVVSHYEHLQDHLQAIQSIFPNRQQ